jgi:hypothetical protein
LIARIKRLLAAAFLFGAILSSGIVMDSDDVQPARRDAPASGVE